MRLRPGLALLAPAGVLAGHAIGHVVAPGPPDHAVDHGYLGLVAAVSAPLALLAMAWTGARAGARAGAPERRPSRPAPVAALAATQCLLFGVQEAIEHALAGHNLAAFLGSPSLWAGLAAQVGTAAVLMLVLRATANAGARLGGVVPSRPVVPGLPLSGRYHAPAGAPLVSRPVTTVASRGPPALSVA
jgi:hypothetical protein